MEAWPHQLQGVQDVLAAIASGERRLALTSPTGGGKTRIMQMLARHNLEARLPVALFTNRRLLIDQLSEELADAGLLHGVRHRDYDDDLKDHPFQVCSLQTENSRVLKRGTWDLHAAQAGGLVLVDEGHLHTTGAAKAILEVYHQKGAAYVLFTATPLGMGAIADRLIVAGTVSELRGCGALVAAHHYGPDEPDMRTLQALKIREGEDLSESQQRKAMMTPTLWGRVWEWFERLNPDHKPTILFAPGVQESIWFAEQFEAKGVKAAHIDGENCWIDGELRPTSKDLREEIFDASRTGGIGVLCNRFVLREGVDLPHLAHGILATVFGSVQTYLQAGGRLLRAYPGLDHVTIQDHGGAWHRHGSLNADRVWDLEFTSEMMYGLRADAMREGRLPQPSLCPKCKKVIHGLRCLACGWEARPGEKRSRPVVTTDGALRELTGDVFKPHRISNRPDGPKKWKSMYFRSRTEKGSRSFRAAMALFALENNFSYPDPRWPYMPTDPLDFFRLVADVPSERLVPETETANA